jgi:hypothetical protein
LKDFTFRHFLAGLGKDFIDALILKFDDFAHSFRIEIVADQNADLVAPNLAGGSSASPKIGVINDIVV